MMYTVYALYSKKFDKIYVGFTQNLEQRLMSHNHLGKKGHTAKYRPWSVVYTESHDTKLEALKRERQLKSSRGRVFVREHIPKD